MLDGDDVPMTAIGGVVSSSGQSLSRRTRSVKGESNFGAGSSLLSSVDGGYGRIYLKIYKTIVSSILRLYLARIVVGSMFVLLQPDCVSLQFYFLFLQWRFMFSSEFMQG